MLHSFSVCREQVSGQTSRSSRVTLDPDGPHCFRSGSTLLPCRTVHPAKAQKLLRTGPKTMTKSSRPRPGFQIPQIPIQLSMGTSPIPGGPTLKPTGVKKSRQHRRPAEVLFPCFDGSGPNLIHVGASKDLTCLGTFHRYTIQLGSGEFSDQVTISE